MIVNNEILLIEFWKSGRRLTSHYKNERQALRLLEEFENVVFC